jgi:mono/diheme cytochrome c family protein
MRCAALLLLLAAGCAAPPAAPRLVAVTREARAAQFPADLGTESLDVSHYPPEVRRGYAAFARACSSCHGLSRALDAPLAGRHWWELYLTSLRRAESEPLTGEQRRLVLAFLEHDERTRKSGPLWDARIAELQRRYDALLSARRRNGGDELSVE